MPKLRISPVVVALGLACGSGPSEAEREQALIASVVPRRTGEGGTVVLSASEREALELRTELAVDDSIDIVRARIGLVLARPQDEAVLASPVAARVVGVTDVFPGAVLDAAEVVVQLSPVLATGEQVLLGSQRAEIEGRVRSVRQELALKEATRARARDLAVGSVVSRQALDEAEAAVESTRVTLAALERARTIQRKGSAGVVELRCPITGRLVSLSAEVGAVVAPGTVLARCRRDGPRRVDVAVPADDPTATAHDVRVGDRWVEATLLGRGAEVLHGMRRDHLEITDENSIPGTPVEVRVTVGARSGVVIPEVAVVASTQGPRVFVETNEGTFTERPIRVDARAEGRVLVGDGLVAGEIVVTQGAMALAGERIREALQPQE